ncbi:MAG: glycosyltransferase [Patescibacteria group bacterium]|jgi:glycosyltransferase involved in cell wall biosynthesis
MKIIYLANLRLPTERAHGLQIMKMCESFAEAKNEVELVVPQRFNKIKEDYFSYYNVKDNFKVTKLPCFDLLPLDRWLGVFALWLELTTFLLAAKAYLFFRVYGMIYTREPLVGLFFKNCILEVHSLPKFNYYFFRLAVKRSKLLIVLTEGIKQALITQGISADKIMVSPDAVDLQQFKTELSQAEAREKLSLPLKSKIIVYTGHLYPWKGVDVLAEAASLLPADCLVVFVGGVKEDIDEFRTKYASVKSILIFGHRPHQEMPIFLKAADALALPNSGKEEISRVYTSPMKLFEYMSSGTPIVASVLPSLREILDNKNSYLVEPDNAQALVDGIKYLLNNEDIGGKLAAAALQKVEQYTWVKRVKNILNFISTADQRFK